MILAYAVCMNTHEARMLKPLGCKLEVELSEMVQPLKLFNAAKEERSEGCVLGIAPIAIVGNPDLPDHAQTKWELGSVFGFTTFNVVDLRRAYVFLRNIAHAIENTMILKMPMAPYYGFSKTFDVRFDIPKEVTNFEQFRRAIMVR